MRAISLSIVLLVCACAKSDGVTDPTDNTPVAPDPVPYTESLDIVLVSATAPITAQTFARQNSAQGGTPPYKWSITSGAVPAGLTMNANGLVTGTPTDTAAYSYGIRVTDALGATSGVTVSGKPNKSGTIEFKTGAITLSAIGQKGQVGYQPFAQGGTPPYKFSAVGLPPGLSIDPATGTISGIPTGTGSYDLSIDLVDAKGLSAPRVSASVISMAPLKDLPSGSGKYAGNWIGQFNLQYEMCPAGYGETSGPGGTCGRFTNSNPPTIQYAALLTGSVSVKASMTLESLGPSAAGISVTRITSLTLSNTAFGCSPCVPTQGLVTFNDPPLNSSTAGVGVAIILPGNTALVTANSAGNAHMSSGGSTLGNSLDPSIRESTWSGEIHLEPLEWSAIPGYKGAPGAKIKSTSWVLAKSGL